VHGDQGLEHRRQQVVVEIQLTGTQQTRKQPT
jgi:hypothetical protein